MDDPTPPDETATAPDAVPAETETPVETAPAVADALATDSAAPAASDETDAPADPEPPAPSDATEAANDENVDEGATPSLLDDVRAELSKIANMPAHIWSAVEEAFERLEKRL